jgi:hypothetical protein
MFVLYFRSRADFRNQATWAKELLPNGWTISEVRSAARTAGQEGFAIMSPNNGVMHMEWFVEQNR